MPKPSLELSMIVRDGAAGLRRCLDSVSGLVDRIVIGDTGSVDKTASIAKDFGAKLISVPWEADFSRARNHVLAQARCDWILFLDADEMLDPEAYATIPALLSGSEDQAYGYDVWGWNYVRDFDTRCGGEQAIANPGRIQEAQLYPAYFKSFHTRLFRRHPEIYFEHCVHETVADRIDALALPRRPGNFIFHHFGFAEDPSEKRQAKNSLYYQLVSHKLAANVRSYQANLEFGISELDHARLPAFALGHFEIACSLEPRRPLGWLYAGICLSRLGRHAEALDRLRLAATLDAANPMAHSALGDVYAQLGSHRDAVAAYTTANRLGDGSVLLSAKMGAAQVQLGEREEGLAAIRKAVALSPAFGELYEILASAAFLAGQPMVARQAADHRLTMAGAKGYHFALAATIHLHTNDPLKAREILAAGVRLFPHDADIQQAQRSLQVSNAARSADPVSRS